MVPFQERMSRRIERPATWKSILIITFLFNIHTIFKPFPRAYATNDQVHIVWFEKYSPRLHQSGIFRLNCDVGVMIRETFTSFIKVFRFNCTGNREGYSRKGILTLDLIPGHKNPEGLRI